MGNSAKYTIPFTGLKPGKHRFSYVVDDLFFSGLDYSPVKKGLVDVKLVFDKHSNFFLLDFSLNGTVKLPCDRCSEEFDQIISANNRLIVKQGEAIPEEVDVAVIPVHAHELDLSPYIYEFINLSVPLRIVHPDDENGNPKCNPKALETLQKLEGDNPLRTDARWEKLKNFYN